MYSTLEVIKTVGSLITINRQNLTDMPEEIPEEDFGKGVIEGGDTTPGLTGLYESYNLNSQILFTKHTSKVGCSFGGRRINDNK